MFTEAAPSGAASFFGPTGHPAGWPKRSLMVKNLFTLTVSALALAAFATTTFAGSCGGCASGEKGKDKDKGEESTQS